MIILVGGASCTGKTLMAQNLLEKYKIGWISVAIENNQSLIIEGWYLYPSLVGEFDEVYKQKIISVYLGFSEEYIMKNLATDIIKNRNVIEKRKYEEERPANQIIEEHKQIKIESLYQFINEQI
jgi:putative acetyltransferase